MFGGIAFRRNRNLFQIVATSVLKRKKGFTFDKILPIVYHSICEAKIMKSTAESIVINEIMSSKNSSTIILSRTDGEHAGFIVDLANNYRTTFWINAAYDNDYSLALAIAYKVLADCPEMLNILNQYNYCKLDFTKDLVIVNAVLEYIAKLHYNCLMIIDNMETVSRDYNLRTVELMLKNCPSNLKIVLVSEKFLDLNYGIFIDATPKLISIEQSEENIFDEKIADEPLSEREFGLLYVLSKRRFVESAFIDSIISGGNELLRGLSMKYRSSVMQTGGKMFNINPKLSELLNEKGKRGNFSEEEYDNALYEYYMGEKGKNPLKALKTALSLSDSHKINDAVKIFIDKKEEIFHLYEFSGHRGKIVFPKLDDKQIYARYFKIINEVLGANKCEDAVNEARKLLTEIEETHPLEAQLTSCYIRALYALGRRIEGAEYAREYVWNKMEMFGEEYLVNITSVVEKLAVGLQSLNMSIIVPRCRAVERFLLDERFSNEFWYVTMLQTFVGCNLDLGNYKKAIEHLNRIKKLIPYYVIPYNMVGAYFFAGDMELAAKTANDIIAGSKWNSVTSNLTDAYILLGLVEFYYNRIDEAVYYTNEAVKQASSNEYTLLNAISIRSMICAEAGMLEYAKDLALLYVKRCEITGSKHTSLMYGAAAYCFWLNKDKEKALHYARKCVIGASARSAFWLISSAIIINYMFEGDDYKSCRNLVEKFFNASKNFGMEMVGVVCDALFNPIINYASENGIETDYVDFIKEKIRERNAVVSTEGLLKIKFMGNTGISVGGQELVWKTKKAKELFLLYVLKGEGGVDRNEIIEMFWGDYVYVSAINNLKTTNNIIRNTLAARGIPFRLEYSNSKYSMRIETGETDYDGYLKAYAKAEKETDLRRKMLQITHLVSLYNDGFANDVKVKYFVGIHEKVKDELVLLIVKLIKDLTKDGEYLEAKRFATLLKKVQPNLECGNVIADIDRKLFN